MTDQPPDLDQHGRPVGAPPDLDASGKPVSAAAPVSALDMVSGRVGRDTGADTAAPDWKANLAGALEPMAHPQTAGDFASLLIPGGDGGIADRALGLAKKLPLARIGMGAAGAGYGAATAPESATPLGTLRRMATYGAAGAMAPTALKFLPGPARQAAEEMVTRVGDWNNPLTVEGRAGRAYANRTMADVVRPTAGAKPYALPGDKTMADVVGTTRGAQPYEMPTKAPAAAAESPLFTSNGDRLPPELAAKVRAQMGPLQPIGQQRPPITVSPESPMQEPRAQVGAEVIGRQNGMTTQQVRDTTGPIRGEAPGAAAGMPSKPMDRIVQKLIDMGPKGQGLPESAREGYAAAATSDKARLQIQAYLDALRKVGFVGAGAAAPALMRDRLVSGIQDQQ